MMNDTATTVSNDSRTATGMLASNNGPVSALAEAKRGFYTKTGCVATHCYVHKNDLDEDVEDYAQRNNLTIIREYTCPKNHAWAGILLPDNEGVNSSNVKAVAYEDDKLYIWYHQPKDYVYVYNDVPKSTYLKCIESESTGTYIATHIKGKFIHDKVAIIDEVLVKHMNNGFLATINGEDSDDQAVTDAIILAYNEFTEFHHDENGNPITPTHVALPSGSSDDMINVLESFEVQVTSWPTMSGTVYVGRL